MKKDELIRLEAKLYFSIYLAELIEEERINNCHG